MADMIKPELEHMLSDGACIAEEESWCSYTYTMTGDNRDITQAIASKVILWELSQYIM